MGHRVLFLAAACLGALAAACGGSPTAPPPVDQSPAVQSITPNAGSTAGGTEVTIRGLRFGAGATVTLGGRLATDVNVQSSDALTARTPPGAGVGAVDVVVSLGGRSGSLAGGFTYQAPPPNVPPTITSITAQGSHSREPANFADLDETVSLSAVVTDPETPADQLQYEWTASLGTIGGTGRTVTWKAPAAVEGATPVQVTITLRVIERYGGIFEQAVSGTHVVRLHNSAREVGGMAVRFLEEFSKPQINHDVDDIMRDFKAAACPQPDEVEAERDDVVEHYSHFEMQSYEIGTASVQIRFAGTCTYGLEGDACVAVPVRWNSIDRRKPRPDPTAGIDYLTAVYANVDSRWWLCSSRYDPLGTAGHALYSSK